MAEEELVSEVAEDEELVLDEEAVSDTDADLAADDLAVEEPAAVGVAEEELVSEVAEDEELVLTEDLEDAAVDQEVVAEEEPVVAEADVTEEPLSELEPEADLAADELPAEEPSAVDVAEGDRSTDHAPRGRATGWEARNEDVADREDRSESRGRGASEEPSTAEQREEAAGLAEREEAAGEEPAIAEAEVTEEPAAEDLVFEFDDVADTGTDVDWTEAVESDSLEAGGSEDSQHDWLTELDDDADMEQHEDEGNGFLEDDQSSGDMVDSQSILDSEDFATDVWGV